MAQQVNTHEIGPFIVIENRMCKISLCQNNSTLKKMYIRCADIETNKEYAVFVKDSLFLLNNFPEGDCSTIISSALEHVANYEYKFRQIVETDKPDPDNLDNVTMYSAGHSNIVIGAYLKYGPNYYVINGYTLGKHKTVKFKCVHMYTKEMTTFKIASATTETKIFKEDHLLEFGTTIIDINQNNYICCYDKKNNIIGFELEGIK